MSISFSEVLVVLVVAAICIKPDKLPEAAATLGQWLRWLRQTTQQVRQAIEKPLEKPVHDEPPHE